jgi:hypothetical protein
MPSAPKPTRRSPKLPTQPAPTQPAPTAPPPPLPAPLVQPADAVIVHVPGLSRIVHLLARAMLVAFVLPATASGIRAIRAALAPPPPASASVVTAAPPSRCPSTPAASTARLTVTGPADGAVSAAISGPRAR